MKQRSRLMESIRNAMHKQLCCIDQHADDPQVPTYRARASTTLHGSGKRTWGAAECLHQNNVGVLYQKDKRILLWSLRCAFRPLSCVDIAEISLCAVCPASSIDRLSRACMHRGCSGKQVTRRSSVQYANRNGQPRPLSICSSVTLATIFRFRDLHVFERKVTCLLCIPGGCRSPAFSQGRKLLRHLNTCFRYHAG